MAKTDSQSGNNPPAGARGQSKGSPQNVAQDSETSEAVVDWEEARTLIPGGTEVLIAVVQAVQTECAAMLAEMDNALEKRDAKQLMRAAHTLKSSARYLGAQPVVDVAWRLEESGRRQALENARHDFDCLKIAVDRMLAELATWLEKQSPEGN